jgi:hypothetical protein
MQTKSMHANTKKLEGKNAEDGSDAYRPAPNLAIQTRRITEDEPNKCCIAKKRSLLQRNATLFGPSSVIL